jgi:hypothetical protein
VVSEETVGSNKRPTTNRRLTLKGLAVADGLAAGLEISRSGP